MMNVDALVIKRLVAWLNDPADAPMPSMDDFEIGETLGLIGITRSTGVLGDTLYPKFAPTKEWKV